MERLENCVICESGDQNGLVCLRGKGSEGINNAAEKRGSHIRTHPGQYVHAECRRQFTNAFEIRKYLREREQGKSNPPAESTPILRSKQTFSFRDHCLFCGQTAKLNQNKRGHDVYPVRTHDFQASIKSICSTRQDAWADQIYGRLEAVNDLHAADAIYHQTCNVNFRTGKHTPKIFSPSSTEAKRGRPVDSHITDAFLKVVNYLQENDDKQHQLSDLVAKMKGYCGDDAYSHFYLKKKLYEHFGDEIIMTEEQRKSTVITIRKTARSILQSFYNRPKTVDQTAEKLNIITTAAKLIKSDILSLNLASDLYPLSSDIESLEKNLQYVPESLQTFLKILTREKDPELKIASIGQTIMQMAKPRLHVAPLQIGLGVQLHHHFSSKFLIDTLHSLGFCSSYSEIQRFETSAAISQGTDIPGYENGQFLQFVADNMDHNVRTLDGYGTFHGMGIIVGSTPGTKVNKPVPKLNVSSADLVTAGKIDIHFYKQPPKSSLQMQFSKISIEQKVPDPSLSLDLLSKVVWPLRSPTPSWSGLMQWSQNGDYPGKSAITFLPMIDMEASDMSCIFSTLTFVSRQARKYGTTPILTFDQPLYMKAVTIATYESQREDFNSIILRLGGFHTQMSFLGCIGHIMRESGLQEVLETVYAPNAVGHILSGKAVARATRAHFLVDTALHTLLVAKTFGIELPENDVSQNISPGFLVTPSDTEAPDRILAESADVSMIQLEENHLLKQAAALYDQLLEGEVTAQDVCNHHTVAQILEKLADTRSSLKCFKTATLWLQYLEMISLLKSFITAERTGNWLLHIQTLHAMLPYFAAAGHNMYAKSAYIYVMSMINLQKDHPDVYNKFLEGYHVLRRSDRYWAGLSCDLVIEQALMRSVKTSGGLTRGRGMTEVQRSQWLLSMPSCAAVNEAMQNLTDVGYHTSEQHKESSTSRQERDKQDIIKVISYLRDRDPFTESLPLRNIDTGVNADNNINAHNAVACGRKIIDSMVGQNMFDFSFKRSMQVVTMSSKTSITVEEDRVEVDPQVLFQRLTAISSRESAEDVADIFKYELSTHPSSIFEPSGLPRAANKPQIADAIWSMGDCAVSEDELHDAQFVLDGGSLLQRIPWAKGMSFNAICQLYVDYIKRRYSKPTVVFDGYSSEPSTKDVTHLRRSKGIISPDVTFTSDMTFKSKKEVFLTNNNNKSRFIRLLAQRLRENECTVILAEDDADCLIVSTAVVCARSTHVVVIGEDTDLLVLLCYHVSLDGHNIYFKSELSNKCRCWDIKKTKRVLGTHKCKILPVIHAITGCDTTSRLFGIGKGVAFKRLSKTNNVTMAIEEFLKPDNSLEIVVTSGEQIIASLYGGVLHEGLDLLRLRLYTNKAITNNKCVQVQSLPPTSDSAALHSRRSYYQCQQWIKLDRIDLNPLDWGWTVTDDGKCMPLKNSLPPAPSRLLNIIHCNCKVNCDTKRCTCQKHGLQCTIGCGHCRGTSCSNSTKNTDDEDETN